MAGGQGMKARTDSQVVAPSKALCKLRLSWPVCFVVCACVHVLIMAKAYII
jgi:hypothetical protein